MFFLKSLINTYKFLVKINISLDSKSLSTLNDDNSSGNKIDEALKLGLDDNKLTENEILNLDRVYNLENLDITLKTAKSLDELVSSGINLPSGYDKNNSRFLKNILNNDISSLNESLEIGSRIVSKGELLLKSDDLKVVSVIDGGSDFKLISNIVKKEDGKIYINVDFSDKNGDKKNGWVLYKSDSTDFVNFNIKDIDNIDNVEQNIVTIPEIEEKNIDVTESKIYPKSEQVLLNTEDKPTSNDISTYNLDGIDGITDLDKESMVNLQKLPILLDIYSIWKDAAKKEANTEITLLGALDKIGFSQKKLINDSIIDLDNLVKSIIENISSGDYSNLKNLYNQFFGIIREVEKKETVITNLSSRNLSRGLQDTFGNGTVEDIFNEKVDFTNKDILKSKMLKIYNLMRNGFLEQGNSAVVKDILWSKISKEETYKDINDFLTNENLVKYLESGDMINLSGLDISNKLEILNKAKDFREQQKLELESKKEDIREEIKKNNPSITDVNEIDELLKERINNSSTYGAIMLLREGLLESKFNNMSDYEAYNLTPESKAYKEISHGWFSDKNKQIASEIATTLAMSAIPMGAGFMVGKLSLTVGSKLLGIGKVETLFSKTLNGANLLKTAGAVAIQGVGFYEGYQIAQNAMYQENFENILKGCDDQKELLKSMAFFSILRGIGKIKDISKIKNLSDKIPEGFIKNTGSILLESGLLVGVSQGIELAYKNMFDEGNVKGLTWEEYIQSLIMILINNKIGTKVKNTSTTSSPALGSADVYRSVEGEYIPRNNSSKNMSN